MGMALETCFQLSTIASTTTTTSRARFLQAHHPFSYKEKHNLPANSGLKSAISSLSSLPNPSTSITSAKNRHNRFICRAKNVVDEGKFVDSFSLSCWRNVASNSFQVQQKS